MPILLVLFCFFLSASAFGMERVVNLSINITQKTCNFSIGISLDKAVYESGEKISFRNTLSPVPDDFSVKYWIEDLFGNDIKKAVETNNLNLKSFTPKIQDKQGVLVIKNVLAVPCFNLGKTNSEKIIVIKNSYFDESVSVLEDPLKTPQITSFYTLAKKFSDSINLHLGVSGGERAVVVGADFYSQIILNATGKYKFNVSVKRGENNFSVFLLWKNQSVDFRELSIVFPKENNTNNEDIAKKERKLSTINEKMPLQNQTPDSKEGITGKVIFESDQKKNLGLVPYYIMGVLILAFAVVLIKKKF